MKYLTDEKRIKAVTVCFTDLEGRLHMLDYDKKFLLKSADNLTFDGSSIRGFSQQAESDLRLGVDWPAFYWLPADIFGPGKVLVVRRGAGAGRLALRRRHAQPAEGATPTACSRRTARSRTPRTRSRASCSRAATPSGSTTRPARSSSSRPAATTTRCPATRCGGSSTAAAEVQRAMGFGNEKDHPEVAPSQFEMNYALHRGVHRRRPDPALQADLPPGGAAAGHDGVASCRSPSRASTAAACTPTCRSRRSGKNLFHDAKGEDGLSALGWSFIDRILANANDICLILNSSVNAYRRLDPHFEAPNQIKASAINRGAMVRIPLGNEKSARVEVRSVAPDANPYLALYALLRTGLEGPRAGGRRRPRSGARAPGSCPTTSTTPSATSRRATTSPSSSATTCRRSSPR